MKKNIKNIIQNSLFAYYYIKALFLYKVMGVYGIAFVIKHAPSIVIVRMLKAFGANIGVNVTVDDGLILHRLQNLSSFKKLYIGNRVHIGHNMLFDLSKEICINEDTAFGAGCQIWTHTGDWVKSRDTEADKLGKVVVGKAVICYSGVIISQGIYVGANSRIAASSVVIRDVEEGALYAGVPAKFIKKLYEE